MRRIKACLQISLFTLVVSQQVLAGGAPAPGPQPPAPAPTPGAGVPELSTGAIGSGLVVVLGAMLVLADYRKRRAKNGSAES